MSEARSTSVECLREFHRATEHRPGAPAASGPFDAANRPTPVKRYVGAGPELLPADWSEPEEAAAAVLSGQAAAESLGLDRTALARLLFLANGTTRRIAGRAFRAAPSAGALYPVELYAVVGSLPGLPAGVYHYEPEAHGLHQLRDGDHRGALARATADHTVADAPATLVLTGIPWRTAWKYGPRGYRHVFWDAGVVLANAIAAADAVGWPTRVLSGFVDAWVARVLDLGDHLPFAEWPVVLLVVESGAAAGDAPEPQPERDPPEALRLPAGPLSGRVDEEPQILQAHAVTELSDPAAVAAWRDAVAVAPMPMASQHEPAPPSDAEGSTIDAVILRRGSTRTFSRQAVPAATARWCLATAMRPLAGDVAETEALPVSPIVAAHAIAGIDPGGYLWDSDAWEPIVRRQDRRMTAHLCLDQPLGGDAAFTAFLLADLAALFEAAGARAYRVAQLTAGVVAGRLQLAAFTAGFGGTGLTFYDDEVRGRFATSADPMLVTALGHPAYRARPGRRPAERAGTR